MTRVRYLQKLEKARSLFLRIARRDLYKLVDQNVFRWHQKAACGQFFTPNRIVGAAKAACKGDYAPLADELMPEHVIVDLSEIHCGMKDKNPLDTVRFYSKRRPKGVFHNGAVAVSVI